MRIKKTSQTTTMPAQVVDTYSESTEDTYACDYINKLHNYSTTEQRIGTYLDKPLYSKVFILNTPILLNASWQNVIDISGMNIRQLPTVKTLNDSSIEWHSTIAKVSGNYLQLYYTGVGGAEWYVKTVILEYTKTTD